MHFAESEIPGVFLNNHFPEVEIHHTRESGRYYVTHHGLVVDQSGDLFGAIELAKKYTVQGHPS